MDFRKIGRFFFAFFIATAALLYASEAPAYIDSTQVDDPKILEQLNEDLTLMQMETGALFVPSLTGQPDEPEYSIFQKGVFIKNAEPGRRVLLKPGEYTLFIGSGPVNFQMKIDVTVERERVSVVKPVWSALSVRTIDPNNNDIRESYSIMDEETKIQIASGTGADTLRGEKHQIWILKPALYRIAKRGESPNSFQNFVTVHTRPGDFSQVVIIYEENTLAVVGGGEVYSEHEDNRHLGAWSFKASISGNFSLVNTGYLRGGSGSVNNFTFGANLYLSAIYDKDNFLFVNRLEVNEQFQKSAGEKLRFIKDLMKFDSSFVYRFNKYVGPYVSVRVRAPLAYRYFTTSTEQDITTTVEESDGEVRELEPDTNFVYAKSFSTTIIQEGIGINAEYALRNIFKINGRVGWGFRQDFNPFAYDISQLDSKGTIVRMDYFTSSYGPEFYLFLSWYPLSFFEIKEEFDALLPINNVKAFSFLSKTTASVWISRFAAIQYEFEVEKSASLKSNDIITDEHSLTVQIYYNFL
ncbi:DUF3078 domain-containing protein [bacterium]|nr:DUF3078 domain-containing protein [bacterium]